MNFNSLFALARECCGRQEVVSTITQQFQLFKVSKVNFWPPTGNIVISVLLSINVRFTQVRDCLRHLRFLINAFTALYKLPRSNIRRLTTGELIILSRVSPLNPHFSQNACHAGYICFNTYQITSVYITLQTGASIEKLCLEFFSSYIQ